ncbi:MAG: hypothetical protein NVS9B4_25040 [Candidatus Acidiferrum sp.]
MRVKDENSLNITTTRLSSVALTTAGGRVAFKYDPFGRRIQKAFTQGTSTTTSNYLYDGDNLVEEVDPLGTMVTRYAQGLNIDEPLAMLQAGVTSYYHADGLGSITSMTDATGAVANTYSYDAFGNTTATGTLVNPFQYTGREFDAETGLYYYRARYYNSNAGRFLSEDPTGFRAGANFYPYVSGNPLIFNDPTGLDNRTERCKQLKKKIQDIDDEIAKRGDELARDKDNLPDSCPGDINNPALSKQGHRRIIRNLKTDQLLALAEYIIRNCSDEPLLPPIPVSVPVPATRTTPAQTSAGAALVVTILILLGLAAAL